MIRRRRVSSSRKISMNFDYVALDIAGRLNKNKANDYVL